MKTKYFADYLDQHPDVSKVVNVYSGKQTAKSLRNVIKNTPHNNKTETIIDGEKATLRSLKPNSVYSEATANGDVYGDSVSMTRNQILDHEQDCDSRGQQVLQKYHFNRALRTLTVTPDLKPAKSFSQYLDQNVDVARYSNLYSSNQVRANLNYLARNTGTKTAKHKHVKSLLKNLKNDRVYDTSVATGRSEHITPLNKVQINDRLKRVSDTVYGANTAFKQLGTFKAAKNLSIKPSLSTNQIKSYTNHKMAKLQHNGVTKSNSNISHKINRSTKSFKPNHKQIKHVNKNRKLRLLKIKRSHNLHR